MTPSKDFLAWILIISTKPLSHWHAVESLRKLPYHDLSQGDYCGTQVLLGKDDEKGGDKDGGIHDVDLLRFSNKIVDRNTPIKFNWSCSLYVRVVISWQISLRGLNRTAARAGPTLTQLAAHDRSYFCSLSTPSVLCTPAINLQAIN